MPNSENTSDLKFPKGKYYLADAGCPLSDELLVPYMVCDVVLMNGGVVEIPRYFIFSFPFKFVHL